MSKYCYTDQIITIWLYFSILYHSWAKRLINLKEYIFFHGNSSKFQTTKFIPTINILCTARKLVIGVVMGNVAIKKVSDLFKLLFCFPLGVQNVL